MAHDSASTSKIGKSEEKPTEKHEKKEKKAKGMSESRIRKWRKLFGQQIANDEHLLDYYSVSFPVFRDSERVSSFNKVA